MRRFPALLDIPKRLCYNKSNKKESGYKSMLDIASGYTPRALMCRKEGIDYAGMDLPAVVDKMAPLAEQLLADVNHPTYVAGDATNAASLKAAADLLDGELFITCEGLLTYLNKSELEQTVQGIREIFETTGFVDVVVVR